MNLNLFTITCLSEGCEYSFISSSDEHTLCPSCGSESIEYSDAVEYELKRITSKKKTFGELNEIMGDYESILLGIVIASSYLSGDLTLARYDDHEGFRLNLKSTKLTDKIIKYAGLKDINELKLKISECGNLHEELIFDSRFDCVEREYYHDEGGNLYESGCVSSNDGKLFYDWIENNFKKVVNLLSSTEFGKLKAKVDSANNDEFEILLSSEKNVELSLSYKDELITSHISKIGANIFETTINDYFSGVELKNYGVCCKERDGKIEVSILSEYLPEYSLSADYFSKEGWIIVYINFKSSGL